MRALRHDVRVVAFVGQRIDEREAIPRVALHVEDERLDLVLDRFHGETARRAPFNSTCTC